MSADRPPTREKILLEASKLFGAQGYHRTSTREISSGFKLDTSFCPR